MGRLKTEQEKLRKRVERKMQRMDESERRELNNSPAIAQKITPNTPEKRQNRIRQKV